MEAFGGGRREEAHRRTREAGAGGAQCKEEGSRPHERLGEGDELGWWQLALGPTDSTEDPLLFKQFGTSLSLHSSHRAAAVLAAVTAAVLAASDGRFGGDGAQSAVVSAIDDVAPQQREQILQEDGEAEGEAACDH